MTFTTALYDLDGTVMNSGPGIMASAQKVLTYYGFPQQSEEDLKRFVGPSLLYSFMTFYNFSEEEAYRAIDRFREDYAAGEVYNATPYPGIKDVLRAQIDAGITVCLVTSKAKPFMDKVLDKFGLREYFSVIACPTLEDLSSDKTRLILRALEEIGSTGEGAVMIGDTHYDIESAKHAGIASIGVSYGYGTAEELAQAAPDIIVNNTKELLPYFGL